MALNATKLNSKLVKTKVIKACGLVLFSTCPTSHGSTMPPRLSPSRMMPLMRAVK